MFVSPMLLQKSVEPFDDNEYITELKLDGIRMILSKFNNKIKLYTRHKNEVSSRFPELLNLDVPDGTVLDGELIVPGNGGKPDFEAVMERFRSNKSKHFIQLCVFDIIYHKEEKVANLPLIKRKELLELVVPEHPNVVVTQWLHGNGIAYFDLIKQQSLEGIVLKRADSKYQINKRSHDWLKVINYQHCEVDLTGIRKGEFGLLLSFPDGRAGGIMEFMPPIEKNKLWKVYPDFILEENDKFIYLKPGIKVGVKYRNLTKNGLLRIPSFDKWIS